MYEHFKKYMKTQKKNFHENQFENDIMYRATCFRQFGVPYRWLCDHDNIPNDYEDMKSEVLKYEDRIKKKGNNV